MGRVYFHRFGRTREGNDSRRRRCSRGMESVVGKMPCGMRVPRMEDGEIVFIQADLFTSSFLRADHSFPYLRTVVSLSLSLFYERGIIRAQQALDSHFYANSRIVLVSSSNHTFFSHAKSSISGRRIYHVMLARES